MRCASPLPRRRAAWLALSLGMFSLLCVTELIPSAQAHHRPGVLPNTPHRRRELDDGGGEDGACRTARARVAQHSGSMPLQRALMDTLNASRAHQYASGLSALFLQVSIAGISQAVHDPNPAVRADLYGKRAAEDCSGHNRRHPRCMTHDTCHMTACWGRWTVQASSTQLFPQRLQTLATRLQAGEAVRVAVVRSRRRVTNQTDAAALDYAVLLAEWLNMHYRYVRVERRGMGKHRRFEQSRTSSPHESN